MLYDGSISSGYRPIGRLERGGMSETWLASRSLLGGTPFVVLKQLLPSLKDNRAAQRSLAAEGELLLQLAHPHIIRAFPMTEVNGQLSLPLEFVYGDTLNSLQAQSLRRGVQLPFLLCAHLLLQYTTALAYLHRHDTDGAKPLTHSDISPQNLMISYAGQAKLIDLGVSNATRTRGQLIAKPAYASPEQMLGLANGPPSDIYALGIVAWEMLVGRRLVLSNHPIEAARIIVNNHIATPRSMRPEIPVALERIALRMLDPNPITRITASELEEELSVYVHRHAFRDSLAEETGRFMRRYAPRKQEQLDRMMEEVPPLNKSIPRHIQTKSPRLGPLSS